MPSLENETESYLGYKGNFLTLLRRENTFQRKDECPLLPAAPPFIALELNFRADPERLWCVESAEGAVERREVSTGSIMGSAAVKGVPLVGAPTAGVTGTEA